MTEERKAAERLAVKGLGAVVLIALCFWLIPLLWDKLSVFIIAIPLAAMMQPVIRVAEKKLKMKRGVSVLICVLLLMAILFGTTYWGVNIVLEQAPEVVGQSGSMIGEAITTIQQAMENLIHNTANNFSPQVQQILHNTMDDAMLRLSAWGSNVASDVVAFAVNTVTSLPYSVIYISFLAMAVYFISIHYAEIRSYLPGGKRRRQDSNTTQLTNSALKSLMGYLRVQGTFAAMVLVVSLIALHIFGFRYAGVLSVIAAIMEMIPMIGSGLMYILMAVVLFLTGETIGGIQILILTGALQLARRLLEPKLMSNSIGISPLLSLIGMFAGMRFGGILGLIGGPVAMSVLVGAIHGDIFKGVNDDLYLVVQWFKRRWAKPEDAAAALPPGGENAPPADGTAGEKGTPAEDAAAPAAPETEEAKKTEEEKETPETLSE